MKNITVIGGGTGSFAVLTGLKKLKDVNLTAIVASTDSGGSSGRLVDEFGYLPPGDVRQCLVALAEDEEEEFLLRKIFSYRFDKGEDGLKGHNFGNLFLTVLRDVLGGPLQAIEKAEKLLNIKGKVYPVSIENCSLVAEYENGSKLIGEHNIDEPPYPHDGRLKIVRLYTEPEVAACAPVLEAIKNSDLIILGPGDLYGSIAANLVVRGVADVIKLSNAKVVYVMNLTNKFGQTFNFKASDFLLEITKYLQKEPDYILINNGQMPDAIIEKYKLENGYPVENDLQDSAKVIEADLIASEEIVTEKGDVVKRSLIRHDPEKVSNVIEGLLSN
jgi:uncharacterized cofD-like protein